MKIVSTFLHGVFDYLGAAALFFAPEIFGFAHIGGPATFIPRALAVVILLQALATNYELGIAKVLPMGAHLLNDYIAGLFLAISPFLFGFADEPRNAWMPHVVVGLAVVLLAAMTENAPRRVGAATAGPRV